MKRKEKPQDEPTGTDVKPDRAERKIAAHEWSRSANFNQKLAAESLGLTVECWQIMKICLATLIVTLLTSLPMLANNPARRGKQNSETTAFEDGTY